ncbi:MAG: polysaccharide deacetylase family protein [Chloroflexi bacterium]|nr:polysaccharide deacetylase family protein [Chloroflexota bacterium]
MFDRSPGTGWHLAVFLGIVILATSVPASFATTSAYGYIAPIPPPSVESNVTPAVRPAAVPTATPTTVPTATPTAVPRLADIHPNELGKIMILEYHVIGDQELRWTRTRESFRRDLEYLYRNGYYLIGLNDLLDNRVRVPAGKTPVVITFDDSNRSQFQFVVGADGSLKTDPTSGLGILEDFSAPHPDFGRSAVFCVLPGADPPNDLFGQPAYRQQKLQYLAREGYEICNHTLWHANLRQIGEKDIPRQIALANKAIQQAVPGYQVNTFNPPSGVYPKNVSLLVDGTFEGTSYHHRAILEVGAGPMTAPNHRKTDFLHMPRIQAIQTELDLWFRYFKQHPEERYVSDGNPDKIVFPAKLLDDYQPSQGAQEEPSPDSTYKVVRLR